jgi:hypothetical protein
MGLMRTVPQLPTPKQVQLAMEIANQPQAMTQRRHPAAGRAVLYATCWRTVVAVVEMRVAVKMNGQQKVSDR